MAPIDAKRTLGEISTWVDGELVGDPSTPISKPVAAGAAAPDGITFAGNSEYLARALSAPIGAIVVGRGMYAGDVPHIVVENARASFGVILERFLEPLSLEPGISRLAIIHSTAQIADSARIGPYVTIGRDSVIGENALVHAHCCIGDRCTVGPNTCLYPRATLVQDVTIGHRATIHSGAVIGADGFGFAWDGDMHVKIPQLGGVQIGDDVEIGANTCIDRGALDDTQIGNGVKIDNHCQIGHNVLIGENSLLTGQVGIGGSAKIGARVWIGARGGVKDHVSIVDDVRIGARTSVLSDIDEPGDYLGTPAEKLGIAMRSMMLFHKLPEIWRRLRALEDRTGSKKESE